MKLPLVLMAAGMGRVTDRQRDASARAREPAAAGLAEDCRAVAPRAAAAAVGLDQHALPAYEALQDRAVESHRAEDRRAGGPAAAAVAARAAVDVPRAAPLPPGAAGTAIRADVNCLISATDLIERDLGAAARLHGGSAAVTAQAARPGMHFRRIGIAAAFAPNPTIGNGLEAHETGGDAPAWQLHDGAPTLSAIAARSAKNGVERNSVVGLSALAAAAAGRECSDTHILRG